MTAVLVTVSLLLLAMTFLVLTRFDKATDQAGTLQTAADSSALAAAQQIAKDAPGELVRSLLDGQGPSCGMGQGAAGDFAGRGGASLVSYCYYPGSDRIEVTVRSNQVLESGRREERSAVARTGMRLAPCSIPAAPTPTPTPTPATPSPSTSGTASPTTPPPPPDVDAQARCGDLTIPITFPGDGGALIPHLGAISWHFEPRLTH